MNTERFDLLRAATGLFVVLGVVLTAVAGYALLGTFDVSLSTSAAMSVLSGVTLVVVALAFTGLLRPQRPRRSA